MIIDGKKIANEILDRLKSQPKPGKFFAGVLVGDDPASRSFQKIKERTAKELGLDYRIYEFPATLSNDDLRDEVGKIAKHKTCGAIVVQLPLPEGSNQYAIVNAIPPEKDPDVLSERSLGAFYNGRNRVFHPAAATVHEILSRANFDLQGKKVVVVGRGFLVGKPVAVWLMNRRKCDVTVLGRVSDFSVLKDADLVIAAAGEAGLITADMLKPRAGVIDFGYDGGKGDFDPSGFKDGWYTPTPGGTGPILVAKLFENFYKLSEGKK